MDVVILTAFSKEFELVRSQLKYETVFKTEAMTHIEGEIQQVKVQLICVGQGQKKSLQSFKAFLEKNPISQILIFGYCGALSPDLNVGDLIFPYRFSLDPRIQNKPHVESVVAADYAKTLGIQTGTNVTTDHPISEKNEKEELYDLSKAQTVDMECFDIVEHCFFEEIPFYALKGVIDDSKKSFKNPQELAGNIEFVNEKLQKGLHDFLGALR